MSTTDIGTGQPSFAAVVKTKDPYLLFNVKANQAYTVRIRYLSRNKGTNSSGETEVLNFTGKSEIPLLPEEYHYLVMLRAGRIIAGELAPLKDKDGNFRYPGMQEALAYFTSEYDRQFMQDRNSARRRTIGRQQAAFSFAGAELLARFP